MATKKPVMNDVVDISLSAIRKKRIRIDGDDNRIIELNTSDLNILSRLKEAYPKLVSFTQEAVNKWPDTDIADRDDIYDSPELNDVITILQDIDKKMRDLIDYIFDSKVADICAPFGSMYDPVNGEFRFEHIINTLSNLYETDLSAEMQKMSTRINKHTSKYTGK